MFRNLTVQVLSELLLLERGVSAAMQPFEQLGALISKAQVGLLAHLVAIL